MAQLTPAEIEVAKKFDLTSKIIPFLDRHLIYPLIENLDLTYDEKTIKELSYNLLRDTYMNKFINDLNPDKEISQDVLKKQKEIEAKSEVLEAETKETLNLLSKKEVQEQLKSDKNHNRRYLESQHGITEDKIHALYEYGQIQYNKGDYVMASDLLANFRILSTNNELNVSSTWGRLACEILLLEWNNALEELSKLRELIDSRTSFNDPLLQLYNRTWVIHWSLFPYFKTANGLETLCDLFFSSSYLSTIQASCPWVLRYLVVAVISNNSKKLKDLVRVTAQESYQYADPFTNLIKALYLDFDFAQASQHLNDCEVILKTDFFLNNEDENLPLISKKFITNAKKLIIQVYVKCYGRISLEALSETLNLTKQELKDLISSLDLKNATLDDEKLIINHTSTKIYQQVSDKVKSLGYKSNQLLENFAK
ncbi:hypothetical protein LJB42_002271 [Komagataella kurtzmanii]|nr:hypothetical protein LJB42_002271 [Komagataella kurtzmanii]